MQDGISFISTVSLDNWLLENEMPRKAHIRDFTLIHKIKEKLIITNYLNIFNWNSYHFERPNPYHSLIHPVLFSQASYYNPFIHLHRLYVKLLIS